MSKYPNGGKQFTDAFGLPISDGTANMGDLASHFRFDPETRRFYVDGNRRYLLYDQTFKDTRSVAEFDDSGDTMTLKPNANQTLTLQSAERFRYVVMYESEFSLAWEANRELQGDEKIIIRMDSSEPKTFGNDGHGIEYTANGANLFITRDGTRLDTTPVSNAQPVTAWTVYDNTFNWYNVGRKKSVESYSNGSEQRNTDLGISSLDRQRGPEVGNGRVTVEVQAGSASDLEVETGSMGYRNLGQVTPKTRPKTFPASGNAGTAGTWVPLGAIRHVPEEFLVTVDLKNISPTNTQDTTEFLAVAVDQSKTDLVDSDFSTPPEANGLSSAIEFSDAITQFPDNDGNVVSSTNSPGGYQIAWSSTDVIGAGANSSQASTVRENLRRLHDTDVAVILARAASTGTIEYEVDTLQEK